MDRLEEVLVELRKFVAEREWQQFHDPKNLAMAIASEAGELLAEYRWVSNAEADRFTKSEGVRRRVAAEAADTGIALRPIRPCPACLEPAARRCPSIDQRPLHPR